MSMKTVQVQDGHSVPYELNGVPKLAGRGETIKMLADVADGLAALGAVAIVPAPVTAAAPEAAKKG